jgi:hypothetical protein
MKDKSIFINERCFDGSLKSYEMRERLEEFLQVIERVRILHDEAELAIHSSFGSQTICEGYSVYAWLSREGGDDSDELEEDTGSEPRLQIVIHLLLSAFTRGPFIENLLDEGYPHHMCEFNQEQHEGTALAAAACWEEPLVSIRDHAIYPDGTLRALIYKDIDLVEVDITHFACLTSVRRARRRYVPNPKHPNRASPPATPMELDRDYDPFTLEKEQQLRALDSDPPETKAQDLLDRAIQGGKQLYNVLYVARKPMFYEFQPDNVGAYHGYPVPKEQIPPHVVDFLIERSQNSA